MRGVKRPEADRKAHDVRNLDAPRLMVPYDSPTVFIRLPSAIVCVSLSESMYP